MNEISIWNTTTLKKTFKLAKLYRELNENYFHNRLVTCTFEALPDPVPYVPVAATIRPRRRSDGGYTAHIKFNSRISWNEASIRQVLIHELIHYYNEVKYGRSFIFSHGLRFQLMKWKINLLYGEHIWTYWHGEKLTMSSEKK